MATKRTKTATVKQQKEKAKTPPKTKAKENKTPPKKPVVQQQTNPFVDKYLEYYDDIKIPSRRYDW